MKTIIALIFTLVVSLSFTYEAESQTSLTTIGTGATKDTIAVINAADTSRQFMNKFEYKTVTVEIYQSATAVWKVYQIAYPVQGVDKFKLWYAQADSSVTINGYIGGEWIQLPIYDYSLTTLSRKLQLLGGGTAWIRMRGFKEKFTL